MAPPTLGVTKIKLFIRVIPRLGVAVEYWVSDTNMHHWTRYVRAWTYAYIITHKVSYICHHPTRIITYFQSMRINIGRFVPAKESLLSLCHRKLLRTRHYLLWIIVHLSSLDVIITPDVKLGQSPSSHKNYRTLLVSSRKLSYVSCTSSHTPVNITGILSYPCHHQSLFQRLWC